MTDFVLSDEEQAAVDKGEAARFLLTHPLFLEAIEAIRTDCAETILTSPPEAKQAREDTYHLSRALAAVTVQLDQLVANAEIIMVRHEKPVEPEQDDQGVHTH